MLTFFFLIIPRPPRSTHFPYTTLFRSLGAGLDEVGEGIGREHEVEAFVAEGRKVEARGLDEGSVGKARAPLPRRPQDRKSTRLNSSHANISYAVFCLKKKTEATLLPLA